MAERSYSKGFERRYIPASGLEVREADDGKEARIVGYPARFNSPSEDLGGFTEVVAPGTFRESLEVDDIRALWNHDSNFVLGRNVSGTLSLRENQDGLLMDNDPPDTQWARDLRVTIKRGDVSQMSFGFITLADEWDETDKKNVVRTLRKVKLFDVSPVTYPAYPVTSVQARGMEMIMDEVNGITCLPRLLLKATHGLSMTDDDRRAFDEVISELRAKFYGELEVHKAESSVEFVNLLSKQLELKVKLTEK